VSFRRDLIGSQLTAWNALLNVRHQCSYRLGPMSFGGVYMPMAPFSLYSLYKAIIQLPVDNNKKI
jgi:hypothetical protein